MGVPAFFRWLSKKYPKIIVDAICEGGALIGEAKQPGEPSINTSSANPNGVEFDNLYLDMNGIIHPCCHPESGEAPVTEEDMIAAIFIYIDHIFCIVRPRKLLYMAIDGVAPRAKMNQQRSRRFRAAQESREKAVAEERLREDLIREGRPLPPEKPKPWDSNVITPGTPFMEKVAIGLRWYINDRMARDPGWKNVKVVLTTSAVPGEGEHKIMDFIRRQRAAPGYDPQTRHCIYGLDADLIMLSLAMHEAFFSILREVVFFSDGRGGGDVTCFRCGRHGHKSFDCPGETAATATAATAQEPEMPVSKSRKPFQFLHTHVLREYLEHAFSVQAPFGFDLDNAIDDWVFTCFFVGNDFLPHLPTLEIREGAIDMMMALYKRLLPQMGGYMTHNGEVHVGRVLMLLAELAKLEDSILVRRRQDDARRRTREREQERFEADRRQTQLDRQQAQLDAAQSTGPPGMTSAVEREVTSADMNFMVARTLRRALESNNQPFGSQQQQQQPPSTSPADMGSTPEPETDPEDQVRLGEMGWRERYYKVKFNQDGSDGETFHKHLCEEYVKGLLWVMKYYYQGCCSWSWYYPFHYAPFACDLVKHIDAQSFQPTFELGEPFKPFEQLMAVLPASSGHCLPEPYRRLMTDESSPISNFYPANFAVDLNGKKFAWQGVVILPFIDQDKLLTTLAQYEHLLTPEEAARNVRRGPTIIYVPSAHSLAPTLAAMYFELDAAEPYSELAKFKRDLNPEYSVNLFGTIAPLAAPLGQRAGSSFASPWPGLRPIPECALLAADFENPSYPPGFVFPARLLRGVILPPRSLRQDELWAGRFEEPGAAGGGHGRFFGQNSASMRMINQATGIPSNQYHDRRNPFMPPVALGPQAVARRDAERFAERSREARHATQEEHRRSPDRDHHHHSRSHERDDGHHQSHHSSGERDDRHDSHSHHAPPPLVPQQPSYAEAAAAAPPAVPPQNWYYGTGLQQQAAFYGDSYSGYSGYPPQMYGMGAYPPQYMMMAQPEYQQQMQVPPVASHQYPSLVPPPPPPAAAPAPPQQQPPLQYRPPVAPQFAVSQHRQPPGATVPFPVQILQRPPQQAPPAWLAGPQRYPPSDPRR